jgi:hypothetical protein
LAAQDRANAIFLGYSVKDQACQAASNSEALRMAPKQSRQDAMVLEIDPVERLGHSAGRSRRVAVRKQASQKNKHWRSRLLKEK